MITRCSAMLWTQRAELRTSIRSSSCPCIGGEGKSRTGLSIGPRARQAGHRTRLPQQQWSRIHHCQATSSEKKGFIWGRIVLGGARGGVKIARAIPCIAAIIFHCGNPRPVPAAKTHTRRRRKSVATPGSFGNFISLCCILIFGGTGW